MPDKIDHAFEFGEFTVIPSEKVLMRSGKSIPIPRAEFATLSYLVQHPNTVVQQEDIPVTQTDLGANPTRRRLSYRVTQLRKILDDDANSPRYIKAVFGTRGYKFIEPVKIVDRATLAESRDLKNGVSKDLLIRTHLLVPMYLGESVYNGLPGDAKDIGGVPFKEMSYEKKVLHVASSGFGVWHIETTDTFPNLTDFAYWRREIYSAIQAGRHSISRFTKEIVRVHFSKAALGDLVAKPGYVFSLNVAANLPYRKRDTIRNALQILACPSALVVDGRVEHHRVRSRSIENLLLEGGVPIKDIVQFGIGDLGFASWDSVSYLASENAAFEKKIIEFDIAVQTLWWTARTIADVFLSGDPKKIDSVRKLIPDIRRQYVRLKAIGSNESPAERMMIEAVLATSRIEQVINEALELAAADAD